MGLPDQILYPDGYVCQGVYCGRIGDGCTHSIPSDCPEDIALQFFVYHWQFSRIHPNWPYPSVLHTRGKRQHTCRHHAEHHDLPDDGSDELQDLHVGGEDEDVPQDLQDGGQDQDEHHVMPRPTDDQPELLQLTGGQILPDVSLPKATDGQPELRQLTDRMREENVQTIQPEDDKTDVPVSQDDGSSSSYLHDSHSHSWSEDDQSWLAHKTWAEDCSSWPTEDGPSAWHDDPGPAWYNEPSPAWHRPVSDVPVSDDVGGGPPNVMGGERTNQFTSGHLWPTDDQPELRQLTGGQTLPGRKRGVAPDYRGVAIEPPDSRGVAPYYTGMVTEPLDGGVSLQPPDGGGVALQPPDGGGVSLQPPGVSLVPPDGWGGSPKFRDKFPDDCPWSRPPECQPELGQLTDTVREERYRVQTFCSTPAAARNYDVGNTLHVSDYLKTQDQLCILDKVKTTHQCTLDILIIAASHDTQHNLL